MREFNIFGEIVDTEAQKCSPEDVCVSDFKTFIGTLEPDDKAVVIDINSCGGSVPAGISIANMIKQLSKDGIKTIARIEGYACSIASVIACACDELQMGTYSFLMIHNAWSVVQGNSNDLRKEADTMDMMNDAIISFYLSKFGLTHDELKALMDDETWISPADAETFKLKCTVFEEECQHKVAAKYVAALKRFNKLPNVVQKVMDMTNENTNEKIEAEEVKTQCEEQKAEEKAEEVAEETDGNVPSVDELLQTIEELKSRIAELEKARDTSADERVSGMQSTMQNKMNAMTIDFKDQLEAKDKELATYKNEAISLKAKLDETAGELQKAASALAEKENALATLNANVNTPSIELPTFKDGLMKCQSLKERADFINSGKYTR